MKEPREDIDEKFEALLDYLKRNRGSDFTGYKRQSLMRRVHRRMQVVSIKDYSEYQDYLEVHPDEFSNLFNTILINITSFFRDKPAWDYLARDVIPKIIESKQEGQIIRVWSAGCASGEEAYSAAMIFLEALGEEVYRSSVKIFATDIDDSALAHARMATYSPKEMEAVPEEMREKYFVMSGGSYMFRTDLRRSIIFGRHDLIQDAPISHLDLLICRNTLMYFNSETQAKILARFHFALTDTGYLFLGRAELLLTHTNLFMPANLKCRILTKMAKANTRDRLLVLAQAGNYDASGQIRRQVRLREVAFDSSSSAEMVIDLNGNLIMASEQARALLSINQWDIGRPFKDLEASYRPVDLRSLIEQAYAEKKTVSVDKVDRHFPDGTVQYQTVRVTPLHDNAGGQMGVMVTFADSTDYYRLVEELQTTNSELMQSTDELNSANSFFESVFMSLRKGVVVIDCQAKILIWNRCLEDMWGLKADDVQGREIFRLDIGLPVARLSQAVSRGAETCSTERLVLDSVNCRGKKIGVKIEVIPLSGAGKVIRGTIIIMEETDAPDVPA